MEELDSCTREKSTVVGKQCCFISNALFLKTLQLRDEVAHILTFFRLTMWKLLAHPYIRGI